MPRQARLDVPGALHHIMVRGINKSSIFNDDQDRQKVVERLGENVMRAGAVIYAWVLMTNHAHILFKSGKQGISAVMRKQLTWYAQYYNRRHRRPATFLKTGTNQFSATRTIIFYPLSGISILIQFEQEL